MAQYVLHFHEINTSSVSLVGGKGANLGEMIQAGFPIPSGFCITTEAYKDILCNDSKFQSLLKELSSFNSKDTVQIKGIVQEIREYIETFDLSPLLVTEILSAWLHIGKEKSYAIRSSATAEDLPNASFAGQQDTYLNIKGEKEILIAIRRCWASLFTDRAVLYRIKNHFPHENVFLSVIVQEMVFADISGIMFTADPISGNRDSTSIDASYGLGEALVGGLVKSDNYKVQEGHIQQKNISQKNIEIVSLPDGGTEKKIIQGKRKTYQVLSDREVLTLAQIGKNVQDHYQNPQDIEWCQKDGIFYIVQSRPITSLYPLPENMNSGQHLFLSIGHLQMMTEAMKPLGLSVFCTLSVFLEKYFHMDSPLINTPGSRLYLDLTNILQYSIFQKQLPAILSNADEQASRIVKNFIQENGEIKIGKSISFMRKKKLFRFALGEIMIFLRGKFGDVFPNINRAIESEVASIKMSLASVPKRGKISYIELLIPQIPSHLAKTNIIRYMPLAVGSYRLLMKLSQKWLGDTKEIDILGKAPEGNITTEMGLLVGDLADLLLETPIIREYLHSAKDEDFWEGLEKLKGSQKFVEKLKAFFAIYGMRCTGEIDITSLRWKYTPTVVSGLILTILKNKKSGEHRKDFLANKQAGIEAGERLIARIKRTSGGWLKSILIKKLVVVYRSTIGIREHPKYFLMCIFGLIQDEILSIAGEFVQKSILEKEEDIFFLTFREIDNLISGLKIKAGLIEERRLKYEQDCPRHPPRIFRENGTILTAALEGQKPLGALSGTAASAGRIQGRARVIASLEEAHLEKGDILVTTYTDPAWTTLFGIVSGVVTEVGGLLTHGAVVAREYGIPAVVGVDGATTKIPDGAEIIVDGTEGWIQIVKK